jgi:hypothetical protein
VTWQKKANAPAYVNMGETFTALITGDPTWGWLLGWVPVLGNPTVDVAALCAAGPPEVQPITIADFIPTHPRNPREQIQANVDLVARLRSLAYDRIYGAYCENVVAQGVFSTYFSGRVCVDHATSNVWSSGVNPVPAGSTQYRVTFANVDPSIFHGWQQRIMFFTDAAQNGRVDYNDGHPPTDPSTGFTTGPVAVPAGHTHFSVVFIAADSQAACADVLIEFNGGGTTPHDPLLQPQPVGLPGRGPVTSPTLPSMAAELDNIEFKLDHVTAQIDYLTSIIGLPPSFSDPAVPVVPDSPVDLTGASGVVVTLSSIPAGADEQFSNPPKFHRIGRLTLGTKEGWLPSFDLEHNPLVVLPLPPGVTRAQVSVKPPTSATVTILRPGK